MYKYIFIFFIFFSSAQAQVNNHSLLGDWTKVKEQAIDGSKNISGRFNRSIYWHVSTNKISMKNDRMNSSIDNNAIDYIRVGNHISTSPDSGYNILKLTNDSLIVVENIKGKIEKDKVQKIWFVKTSKITSAYKEKHKNDSVLTATPSFTPILKKDFMTEVKAIFLKNKSLTNLIFKGNLIIYPKKRTIKLETVDQKIAGTKNFQTIKGAAENSFVNWNLTNFENFETIYIPYVIESKVVDASNGVKFATIDMHFFRDVADLSTLNDPKMADLELAQKTMQKAVIFLQSKKYDKAVEFFNKGYELDSTKVDALYNIVSIYSFLKDKNNMCLTLKKLKDLEQTDGTKLYDQFCIQ